MRCLDERKIQLFVDKRIEPKELGVMTSHLVHCQVCQARVEEYRRLDYLVREATPVYGETAELERKVLDRIGQLTHKPQWVTEPEPVSLLSWLKPWAVQVAALWMVAILLGSWLGVIIGTTSQRQATPLIDTWTGSLVQILSQRSERGIS